jgi:hypothetical protein
MYLDFDLEYAKLGLACGACKLITRSGRPAQINDWNYTREGYPLSGWIQKESGLVLPVTWTETGKFWKYTERHPLDLFIEIL